VEEEFVFLDFPLPLLVSVPSRFLFRSFFKSFAPLLNRFGRGISTELL
jgi:hypothetical protein